MPGIFFAVELGTLATIPVMMFLFRKDKAPVSSTERTAVSNYVPTIMLLLMVAALITASFIPDTPQMINGIICCVLAMVTILIDLFREKKGHNAIAALKNHLIFTSETKTETPVKTTKNNNN